METIFYNSSLLPTTINIKVKSCYQRQFDFETSHRICGPFNPPWWLMMTLKSHSEVPVIKKCYLYYNLQKKYEKRQAGRKKAEVEK